MSNIETGGPAFPVDADLIPERDHSWTGMTLRDYFAAKAMNQLVGLSKADAFEDAVETATWVYAYADAMMGARK